MQKTEHLARLPHLSPTGKAFCLGTSLMVVIAVSGRAGETVMTLAMADYHPAPVESHAPAAPSMPSVPDSSPAESTNNATTRSRPERETATEFSTELRLDKPAKSGEGDALQLVHKSLSAFSRSNVTFSVQAGYERIWDEQSMLQKISPGHQETGCAYVAANISF